MLHCYYTYVLLAVSSLYTREHKSTFIDSNHILTLVHSLIHPSSRTIFHPGTSFSLPNTKPDYLVSYTRAAKDVAHDKLPLRKATVLRTQRTPLLTSPVIQTTVIRQEVLSLTDPKKHRQFWNKTFISTCTCIFFGILCIYAHVCIF